MVTNIARQNWPDDLRNRTLWCPLRGLRVDCIGLLRTDIDYISTYFKISHVYYECDPKNIYKFCVY